MGGYFLLSFLLLLLLSYDSFLMHIGAPRCDSSWFFMCGKAWMEGMTPYVDFADSKGILLWLIYGIGYLMSPTSYIGVFWLSVIAYAVTFHFIYKTARLFLDRRQSLLVLAFMPFFLFLCMFHNEVRAEDFCYPAVCAGIYYTIFVLRDTSRNVIRQCAFGLGIAMMWCLLIKWSIFFMMGGMALIVVGVSFSKKSADGLLFGLLGMMAMALPFLVYFLIEGNFGAFIQEYFITTFKITGGSGICNLQKFNIILGILVFCVLLWLTNRYKAGSTQPAIWLFVALVLTFGIFLIVRGNLGNYVLDQLTMASAKQGAPHWLSFLAKMWGVLLGIIKIELATINFPIVCVSILLFCRYFNISKWVLFSFVPFYCFLQLKASFPYYYTIATPFYIFFMIYAISIFTKGQIRHSHFATSVIVICCLLYNIPWDRLIFFENKDSENIETGMRLIAKKQFARIVFIGGSNGCELLAQALPGCKYWARQNGTTKEMIDDRNEAIRSRKTDFVVVSKKITPRNTYALLNNAGYKPCYKFLYKMEDGQSNAWLYVKQEFLSKYKPTTNIPER